MEALRSHLQHVVPKILKTHLPTIDDGICADITAEIKVQVSAWSNLTATQNATEHYGFDDIGSVTDQHEVDISLAQRAPSIRKLNSYCAYAQQTHLPDKLDPELCVTGSTPSSVASGNPQYGAQAVDQNKNEKNIAPVSDDLLKLFASVPDHVIAEEYYKPYDLSWVSRLNVDAQTAEVAWTAIRSKLTMEDMFRRHVFKVGDVFRLAMQDTKRDHVDRFVRVESLVNARPCIRFTPPASYSADPTIVCSGTTSITKAVIEHYGDVFALVGGWKGLYLIRDDYDYGSCEVIRAHYQLWTLMVKDWTLRALTKFRPRRSLKTGGHSAAPGVEMMKKPET
ncbi:MAG: hypothetical protein Q9219_003809 [cf. Caloplaca sp. 3 TL-2023]